MRKWAPPPNAVKQMMMYWAIAALGDRSKTGPDLQYLGTRGRLILAGKLPATRTIVRPETARSLAGMIVAASDDVVRALTGAHHPFRQHGKTYDKHTAPEILSDAMSVANLSALVYVTRGGITFWPATMGPLSVKTTLVASCYLSSAWAYPGDIDRQDDSAMAALRHSHRFLRKHLITARRYLPPLTDTQKDVALCISPGVRRQLFPWLAIRRRIR